ncbi:hypothetical protein J8J42_04610 [Chryseobacterium sp. cx-311]|uniref:hypothetical protein n=1 Tax=Marnyiella aurantia TaxID=2758037 RepID=UPI001AE15A9E|nr:hypothetical protein [Marnyiella aurantia]MBP0612327.1 hypothetical protein [Marnyiella aurantia]
MNKENLRLVRYKNNQEEERIGIFHRWIQKRDDTILALVEAVGGDVIFLKTEDVQFLNFQQAKEHWAEIDNASLH